MSIQKMLKTLKTVKSNRLSIPYQEIPNFISKTLIVAPCSTILSDLNPTKLHQILSDPHLNPSRCLHFFNYIIKNQSSITFEPDLQSHITLISRLLEARMFSDAENFLKSVSIDEYHRYPFPYLASTIENCCCCLEPKVVTKLFNLLLKVYSDNNKFDKVIETFDHMKKHEIGIDERTCTIHLLALTRSDRIRSSLEFFNRMIDSGIEVSVYSFTVVISGLCKNGEIKRCRRWVEEMASKGIKPNIVTYNVMIDACAKRWDFEELDSILHLIEKQGEAFNVNTYKILIDGYTSSGKFQEAEELVLEIHDRDLKADTHMYNLIIKGYCKLGLVDRAVLLFDKMTSRCVNSNVDTFSALINGICKAGKMEVAMVYVGKMRSKGIMPGQDIFDALVDGFCSKGMVDEALQLAIQMETIGFDVYTYKCCKIVGGLLKLKRFEEAEELVNIMVRRGGSPAKSTTVDADRNLV